LYTLIRLTYWNGEQESIWIPNYAEQEREREMNRQMEEERERQMDRQTNVSLLKSNFTSMQRYRDKKNRKIKQNKKERQIQSNLSVVL
jgi:Golgi nucleoside diphosphatase